MKWIRFALAFGLAAALTACDSGRTASDGTGGTGGGSTSSAADTSSTSTATSTGSSTSRTTTTTTTTGSGSTTEIRVHYDTGLGNSITLRGDGAGLSWDVGQPCQWTEGDTPGCSVWSCVVQATTGELSFKP